MSNEYIDWLWDYVQDLAFERNLVDKITKVDPADSTKGRPVYIWGIKNEQRVKYFVHYDDEFGYSFEHRELDT